MRKDKKLILWPLLTITTLVTNRHTHGNCDSLTDPARRDESVKMVISKMQLPLECITKCHEKKK